MGSSNVMVGDAVADTVKKVIQADGKDAFIRYPHGIALNEAINRLIVTSTLNPGDLKDAGDSVTVIEADSGDVLSTARLGAAGSAPVEVVFVPHKKPPLAYIATLYEGKLWSAEWRDKTFAFRPVFDFGEIGQGVPLEIYFDKTHARLYVTSAKPGALNIFDIAGENAGKPVLIKSVPAAPGAHHVVFTPDERYALVQNNLLNLPDMNDGSISVIDLKTLTKIGSIDTFKEKGLRPHDIYLLPPWHTDDAH